MAKNELLDAALGYAAQGWPVFPCRTNKAPRTPNGVLDATTDPEKIREWWGRWPGANIGVNCGEANLLVLDYDPGSDPDALADILPEPTLVARTPRGGTHEYYELPPDSNPIANSTERVAPHIDVRSFHGYVLLPPSHTADGSYRWEVGSALDKVSIPNAPAALLELARSSTEKSEQRDEWIIEPDLDENVQAAEHWLKTEAKPAIEGSGGDNTTYATAAMMKSHGLSEETALEVMWDCWNERCSPPWDYDDLAAKVRNGYSYNTSPPGNITTAYKVAATAALFRPKLKTMEGGGTELQIGRFRIVDRDGLESIKPPRWLIPDFLPENGYGLLIGAPGSFKTFVALDAALQIAGGGAFPWEERQEERETVFDRPTVTGPVLYIAGEGRAGIRQRVRAWESLHMGGRRVANFDLCDPVPRVIDGSDGLDEFINGLRERHPDGYRLVVLDTIGRAMQGVNENAQEHASAFTAMAERLQRGLDAAVLGLHHTGHEHTERGRGSSVFIADADTSVTITRPKRDGRFAKMTMHKQKDAPEWDSARWVEALPVKIGMKEGSLATARAKPQEAAVEDRQAVKSKRAKVTVDMVDERAFAVLSARPGMELSQSQLSDLIESHTFGEDGGRLGIRSRHINDYLKELRASEEARSTQFWNAEKRVWRYSSS